MSILLAGAPAFAAPRASYSSSSALESLGFEQDMADIPDPVMGAVDTAIVEIEHAMSEKDNTRFAEAAFLAGVGQDAAAGAALLKYLDAYNARGGKAKVDISEYIALINSIWALGEIKDPASYTALELAFKGGDMAIGVNAAVAMAKTDPVRTRRLLDDVEFSGPLRNIAALFIGGYSAGQDIGIEPGDIVYRKGYFGLLNPLIGAEPIGHVGAYVGTQNGQPMVIEGWIPVRKLPLKDFIGRWPYYGNKTTMPAPSKAQRAQIVGYLFAQLGKPYDYLHSTQEGPRKFDCVGLVEKAYEWTGLDPTPEKYETGIGWPLTPTEQFMHTFSASEVIYNPIEP